MAGVFLSSGGDIAQVLRALFGSAEFWSEAFATRKPRTPVEYVFATLRAVGSDVSSPAAVRRALTDMGQPLYACNPPTGYSNRGADWISPSAQLYRMNFALDLAAGAVAGVSVDTRGRIRAAGGDPDDPRSAAAALNADAFGGTLSAASLGAAAQVAASGSVPVSTRVAGPAVCGPRDAGEVTR